MVSFKMRGRKAQNQKPKLTPQDQQAIFEFREGLKTPFKSDWDKLYDDTFHRMWSQDQSGAGLKQLGAYTAVLGSMDADITFNGLVAKEDEWVNTLLSVDGTKGYYEGILERKDTPLAKLDRGEAKIVKEGGKYSVQDIDFTNKAAGYTNLTLEQQDMLQEEAIENGEFLEKMDSLAAEEYHKGYTEWDELTGAQRFAYYELYAPFACLITAQGGELMPPYYTQLDVENYFHSPVCFHTPGDSHESHWRVNPGLDKASKAMLRFIHE